ncbi:hypothetical protein [Streptomyces sp. PSKA30]|uniref:HNH endonuclease n=1 Tax=Streptomyces sp. PSKA30 TaxID=2874597 RepID=UPI0035B1305F
MQCSLTKTLAHKYRISVPEVYRRYRAVLATDRGPRAGLQVVIERGDDRKPLVAEWGGISLARRTMVRTLDDQPPKVWNNQRSELVQRLLAETCELCGSAQSVEVHHVRHLKDLRRKGRAPMPAWAERMASRQRKTLVVCRDCPPRQGLGLLREPGHQAVVPQGTGHGRSGSPTPRCGHRRPCGMGAAARYGIRRSGSTGRWCLLVADRPVSDRLRQQC